MLHEATLHYLRTRKNLLAFSGGGDSAALFFLLLEHHIPFDIAHVNYQTRDQSNEEERYAKMLAQRYGKDVFTTTIHLASNNFEHHARKVRYDFFETLLKEKRYNTLLMAHHLGDQLEWFLMQLCKGAGLVELLGMREYETKEEYTLVRPLLHLDKSQLHAYLIANDIVFFEDESNKDPKYLRNRFRHQFATPLLQEYAHGIARSFAYLEADRSLLEHYPCQQLHDMYLIRKEIDDVRNMRAIDYVLKRLGKVLSKEEREEVLRTKECVVGGKFAICFQKEFIFIAPYVQEKMPKSFKELCRKNHISPKIRPYLYRFSILPQMLHSHQIP